MFDMWLGRTENFFSYDSNLHSNNVDVVKLMTFLSGITSLTKPKLRGQGTKPRFVAVPVPLKRYKPINPALNNLQLTNPMVKKRLKITLKYFSNSGEEMSLTN